MGEVSFVIAPGDARLGRILQRVDGLHIWHEDEHCLVVEKPAGLLSVAGRGEAGRDHLHARLQALRPDALVVHRLDMATSGLMVFARHLAAQRELGRAFELRQVHKRYEALVHGWPEGDDGEVDLPLAVDWPRRPLQHVDREHGRPARTRWRCRARLPAAADGTRGPCARLDLWPVTGRSHQLRVHLLAIGHPIVGDDLYGPDARPPLRGPGQAAEPPGRPASTAAAPGNGHAARMLLHAAELAFPHPAWPDRPVRLASPVPF